jgi:hypothetical protein
MLVIVVVAVGMWKLLARGLNAFEVERSTEKTVGTFVGRLLQKRGQLWVVPTISLELIIVASHRT